MSKQEEKAAVLLNLIFPQVPSDTTRHCIKTEPIKLTVRKTSMILYHYIIILCSVEQALLLL